MQIDRMPPTSFWWCSTRRRTKRSSRGDELLDEGIAIFDESQVRPAVDQQERVFDDVRFPELREDQAAHEDADGEVGRNAGRALRAAVIGLMLLPLGIGFQSTFERGSPSGLVFFLLGLLSEGYATRLLLSGYDSRKNLHRRSLRKARLAVVLNGGFYLTLAAVVATLFLPPISRDDDDPRGLAHPGWPIPLS